jgi:hypothetical protein
MNIQKNLLLSCLLALYANLTPSFAQESTPIDPNAMLAGKWQMVASPFEGGSATIDFTVLPALDEGLPTAMAESFYTTKTTSHTYPAQWNMKAEVNGTNMRVGWVLDAENPSSPLEFQEPASEYALFGADADEDHRYIYFLTENIETQKLEPLTLWSDWVPQSSTSFALPKIQQLYAVVSKNKPYSGVVGYVDIWASITLNRVADDAAISTVSAGQQSLSPCYDLSGRRLHGTPQHGLYIQNGKKVVK